MTLLVVTTSLAPQCGHLAGRAAVFGSGSAVRPPNVGLNFDGNGIDPHKREALVRAQPEMAEKLRKAEHSVYAIRAAETPVVRYALL